MIYDNYEKKNKLVWDSYLFALCLNWKCQKTTLLINSSELFNYSIIEERTRENSLKLLVRQIQTRNKIQTKNRWNFSSKKIGDWVREEKEISSKKAHMSSPQLNESSQNPHKSRIKKTNKLIKQVTTMSIHPFSIFIILKIHISLVQFSCCCFCCFPSFSLRIFYLFHTFQVCLNINKTRD